MYRCSVLCCNLLQSPRAKSVLFGGSCEKIIPLLIDTLKLGPVRELTQLLRSALTAVTMIALTSEKGYRLVIEAGALRVLNVLLSNSKLEGDVAYDAEYAKEILSKERQLVVKTDLARGLFGQVNSNNVNTDFRCYIGPEDSYIEPNTGRRLQIGLRLRPEV